MVTWALLPLLVLTAAPRQVKVAVPNLEASGGITEGTAELLTDVMAKAIDEVRPGAMQVITASMIRSVIGLDRQKQLLGCTEQSNCLVEIGNALGADLLVSSKIGKLGSTTVINVTLIDLAKTQPDLRLSYDVKGPDDNLIAAARTAGRAIGGRIVATRVTKSSWESWQKAPAPAKPSPVATPAAAPKPASPALLPAAKAKAGFPYERYPAPLLDHTAAGRYLRGHP